MKSLSLLFVFFVVVASAQDLKVTYGAPQTLPMSDARNMLLFGDASQQFVMYYHGMGESSRKQFASPLKSDMTMSDPKPWGLPLKDEGAAKTVALLAWRRQRDHYNVFYQAHFKDKKIGVVYGARMNFDGSWGDDVVPLDTVSEKLFQEPQSGVLMSPDSTKFLLYNIINEKTAVRVTLKLIDQNFKTLYYTGVQLPSESYRMTLSDMEVDNAGNLYILGLNDVKGRGNECSVFTYNAGTKKLSELKVPKKLEDETTFIHPNVWHDDGGNFYFTSGWGKKEDTKKGITIGKISKDGNKFDYVIAKNFETDFQQNEDIRKRGEHLGFDRIFAMPNNQTLFMLENAYAESSNNGGVLYYSRDLLALCLKPNGDMVYFTDIPKDQTGNSGTVDMLYSRYIKTDKNLFILYNDKVKNAQITDYHKMVGFSSAHYECGVMVAKLDLAKGTYTKSVLTADYPDKDKSPLFDTSTFMQMNNNTYMVKCDITAADKFRFARITVQ